MMPDQAVDVFVSYRRKDSPGHAGRIRDALVARFGTEHVFYDLASVPGGANFARVIEQAVAKSTIVIAVIGPHWRHSGRIRRWLGERDWVSLELAQAGKLRKPVLPVLVGGAAADALNALPPVLGYMSFINAFPLRDEHWDRDVALLLDRLPFVPAVDPSVALAPPSKAGRRLVWAATAIVLPLLFLLLWRQSSNSPLEPSRNHQVVPAAGKGTAVSSKGESVGTAEFVGSIEATGAVTGIAFSPDGRWIATGGGNSHTMTLWNASTGKRHRLFVVDGVVSAVAFSRDSTRVATDSALFDIATGERIASLDRGGYDVAFSPDGKYVATASGFSPSLGTRVFDQAAGNQLKLVSAEYAASLAFSHDGTQLATATGYLDKGVRLWSTTDFTLVRTLEGPSERVAFSNDGSYLAAAGKGGVRLFRPSTGAPLRDISGGLAGFSPDGRVLATTGEDRRVRLYDPATGNPIRTLSDVYAKAVAFSPDGQRIATIGPDDSVQVSRIGSGQ